MKDNFEGGKIIPHSAREKVDLPVVRDALWHSSRHHLSTSSVSSIPKEMQPGYRTHPQVIKDFFRNLFVQLKRRSGRG